MFVPEVVLPPDAVEVLAFVAELEAPDELEEFVPEDLPEPTANGAFIAPELPDLPDVFPGVVAVAALTPPNAEDGFKLMNGCVLLKIAIEPT